MVCLSLCLACACNSSDSDDNSPDLKNETSAEYFNFTLLSDDTYEISAKDVINMPAEVVIPSSYNGKAVTSIGSWAFDNCISLSTVYYYGTEVDWAEIDISSRNTALTDATRYYYREDRPEEEGNFWHLVNGEPTVW